MLNPAVEYACERFAVLYNAPNIITELNGGRKPGIYAGDALVFTMLFPDAQMGLEKYSRQDLTPELFWFVRGYLGEYSKPQMSRIERARSLLSKNLKSKFEKSQAAFLKGAEERKAVLDEISTQTSETVQDLGARLSE